MRSPKTASCFCPALLQLRLLRFGLLQDGDFGVGIFPEGEEIFVGAVVENLLKLGGGLRALSGC